jgi:hypothetical protein
MPIRLAKQSYFKALLHRFICIKGLRMVLLAFAFFVRIVIPHTFFIKTIICSRNQYLHNNYILHCPCTFPWGLHRSLPMHTQSHSALQLPELDNLGTCSTFHASSCLYKFNIILSFSKNTTVADLCTHQAVNTFFRIILKCILYI